MPEYPDTHPRAEEIKTIKADIGGKYAKIIDLEDKARGAYKIGMQGLKDMGEAHREIHNLLRNVAEQIEVLKGIIDSPRI